MALFVTGFDVETELSTVYDSHPSDEQTRGFMAIEALINQ